MTDVFDTTRWGRVLAAGGRGAEATDALAWLCPFAAKVSQRRRADDRYSDRPQASTATTR